MKDKLPANWHSRGYLPHFDKPGLVQHICFHLGDSLPKSAIRKMELQLQTIEDEEKAAERRKRIDSLLDAGHGSCVLKDPIIAKLVEDCLKHFHKERYDLLSWVIMPNHVHALIKTYEHYPVAKIVQSWKRFSATQILKYLKSQFADSEIGDPFWQRDYFDRYIRDEADYLAVTNYIENNPFAAELCTHKNEWTYSSATA